MLSAANLAGMRHIYPKRDSLFTTSLDGTWSFKLVNGLDTPDELKGWNEPGYDTREWDDIKDIELKGSFTIYAAELDASPPDVVPDLTFTNHYGF